MGVNRNRTYSGRHTAGAALTDFGAEFLRGAGITAWAAASTGAQPASTGIRALWAGGGGGVGTGDRFSFCFGVDSRDVVLLAAD